MTLLFSTAESFLTSIEMLKFEEKLQEFDTLRNDGCVVSEPVIRSLKCNMSATPLSDEPHSAAVMCR